MASFSQHPETLITVAYNYAFNLPLCQTEVHGGKIKTYLILDTQHLGTQPAPDGCSGVPQSFIESQLCASFWARPDTLLQRTTSLTSFSFYLPCAHPSSLLPDPLSLSPPPGAEQCSVMVPEMRGLSLPATGWANEPAPLPGGGREP